MLEKEKIFVFLLVTTSNIQTKYNRIRNPVKFGERVMQHLLRENLTLWC